MNPAASDPRMLPPVLNRYSVPTPRPILWQSGVYRATLTGNNAPKHSAGTSMIEEHNTKRMTFSSGTEPTVRA